MKSLGKVVSHLQIHLRETPKSSAAGVVALASAGLWAYTQPDLFVDEQSRNEWALLVASGVSGILYRGRKK